jgi:hypothetical protein
MMRPFTPSEPSAPVGTPPAPVPPKAPPAPLVLWPLIGFNRAFDACLLPLGGLGRWFRGPAGRNALATVGLLCLCAAVALVLADGIHWSW